MLGAVVEQFGSRSERWLQVLNRGGTLAEALYVAGGQEVEKSGESGIYHMGTKQSVCALISMGYEVAISSYDPARGRYFMTFSVAETKVGNVLVVNIDSEKVGHEEIVTTYTLHLGYTLTRALGSDTNPIFKAVNQFVVNAYEAVKGNNANWDLKHVDSLSDQWNRPTVTSVFISADDYTHELIEFASFYWKAEGHRLMKGLEPIITLREGVEIWPSSVESNESNHHYVVYVKSNGIGYLAHSEESDQRYGMSESGIGDYVVTDNTGELLDGDRQIADMSKVLRKIGTSWARSRDAKHIAIMLKAAENNLNLEHHISSQYYFSDKAAAKKGFRIAFPNGVLDDGESHADRQYAVDQGKQVVELSYQMRALLKEADIPTVKDALQGQKVDRMPTPSESARINRLMEPIISAGLAAEGVRYKVLLKKHDNGSNGDQCGLEIRISERSFEHSDVEMTGTLVHEHRHVRSGATDNEARFTNAADKDIATLIMTLAELVK